MNQARATAVTTRTLYKAPAPAGWGFDFTPLKQFFRELFHGRPPMAMYREEVATILGYQKRLEHRHVPLPWEGSAAHAVECFFVRTFSGTHEVFEVNTATKTITPLSFFAKYCGEHEWYCDLEIGTSHDPS